MHVGFLTIYLKAKGVFPITEHGSLYSKGPL